MFLWYSAKAAALFDTSTYRLESGELVEVTGAAPTFEEGDECFQWPDKVFLGQGEFYAKTRVSVTQPTNFVAKRPDGILYEVPDTYATTEVGADISDVGGIGLRRLREGCDKPGALANFVLRRIIHEASGGAQSKLGPNCGREVLPGILPERVLREADANPTANRSDCEDGKDGPSDG